MTAQALPDWTASSSETRAKLESWARERGLDYQAVGLLPPVSNHLSGSLGGDWHHAGVQRGRGGVILAGATRWRPPRFSENLCGGVLPGGLRGTLAHHSRVWRLGSDEVSWVASADTCVVARVEEATRVTRELTGSARASEGRSITVTEPEYGPATKDPGIAPGLQQRLRFEVDADEDAAPLAGVFDATVVEALLATPALTRVCVRDGWVTVELPEIQDDPAVLDALCAAASALASALRREAARLPALDPAGGPLPEPPATPFQRYLDEGVARVSWTEPPPDVETSMTRYLEAAQRDPRAGRRGRRGFAAVFVLVFAVGLIPAAISLAGGDTGSGLVVLGTVFVLALGLGALAGRTARTAEVEDRTRAWGREAFVREYARVHGLRMEDPEELRRRIALPWPGRPERSMYGRLGDSVDGRLVIWRDRTDPESGNRAMNLALVPAPPGEPGQPRPPYQAVRARGWLVLAEDLGTGARTAAGLEALAAEAVRLVTRGS